MDGPLLRDTRRCGIHQLGTFAAFFLGPHAIAAAIRLESLLQDLLGSDAADCSVCPLRSWRLMKAV